MRVVLREARQDSPCEGGVEGDQDSPCEGGVEGGQARTHHVRVVLREASQDTM